MADQRRPPELGEPRPLVGIEPGFGTAAGAGVTLRIAVTNASQHPRVLSVSAVGVDASWVDGQPHTPTLEPGGTAVVEVRLTPPIGTLPARYPLMIAAQALDPVSGQPTSVAGTAETALTVNPRTQLSVDLQPRELRLVGSRRFTALIRNGGAAPAKVNLIVQASSRVTVQLGGGEIVVAPGATTKVRGRIRAKKPQMLGGRQVHPFTVTARGTESVKHVDAQVIQRSVIGPSGLKALALLLVLAVWVGAAVIFIPSLAEKVRTMSEESAAADGPGGAADEAGADDPGASEDGGDEEGGGDEAGPGEEAADAKAEGLQIAGTVAADDPTDVSVRLETIALVEEATQGGIGVGVPQEAIEQNGKRLMSAFVRAEPRKQVPPRSVVTEDDGSWGFAKVKAPGYYLLTFSKPGFQSQKFIIDSSNEAAAEPLEVEMAPGEGFLSGRITGPGGSPLGGAEITITDGTNTLTTSSTTEASGGGAVGSWSVSGLSTPSTYVVTATKHNMSSEARVVTLAAGATGTASLALVPGVATLTGKVTGADEKGLAGITVTVNDGTGTTRTATTLTQPRGLYTLPSLPTPGNYTVTFSGDGFQSKTRTLDLAAGESPDPLAVSLRASTGEVTGVISRKVATAGTSKVSLSGLENAGLTLANADHTYKTTSTSVPEDGTFAFTGVAPGTYVLTTRYFGLATGNTTIEVGPGESVSVDPALAEESGSGVPAKASITGSVVDAVTGLALPACPVSTVPKCIEASVEDAGVIKADGTTASDTYEIAISPDSGYELPDPDADYPDDVVPGLRPGLHTVKVTAPGYEAGSVDVEVAQGRAVEAPLVELFPAPRIEGTVSTTLDAATFPESCVFVRTARTAGDPLPPCDAAATDGVGSTPPTCAAGTSTYDGATAAAGETRWCAVTDANGAYSVQVPEPGTYALTVVPSDVEYVPATHASIELTHGETHEQSVALDRYGRLRVRVLAPDGDDALSPAVGRAVTVTPDPRVLTSDLTDPDGYTTVSGLLPNQTYTASATVVVPVDPAETGTSKTTLTGSVPAEVAFNEEKSVVLRLTKPLASFVGKVTGRVDNADVPVAGAGVVIKAAISFAEDGSAEYGTPIQATTDAVGCFGIDSTTTPERGTACARPGYGATTWAAGSLARRQMVTNIANSVEVTATGYDALTLSKKALSTVQATGFSLTPTPVTFAARVRLNPAPSVAPTWSQGTVTVTDRSSAVASVTSTVTARAGSPDLGDLTWAWTRADGSAGPAGTALPGTYDVSFTLPGYQPATGVLVCATGGACAWQSELVINRLAQIEVRVVTPGGTAVPGRPVVTKLLGSTSVEQTTSNLGVTTFSNIAPDENTPHRFEVKAAGYAFGTSNLAPVDGAAVVLECDHGSSPGKVTVVAGQTTTCTATLTHRLGTLTGTLRGLLGPQGDTGSEFEHLTGVKVTATRCADTACASLTDEKRTQTTTLADTANGDDGGEFTFTGSTSVEGLVAGSYLLTAVPPAGFDQPDNPLHGTVVQLADGEQKTNGHAYLYAKRVAFDVRVVDQHGVVVKDATSVRLTKNVPPAAPGTGDPTATRTGSGTDTRYRFSTVIPGPWTVWAYGPGFRGASITETVHSSATGTAAEITLVVTRTGAQVSGVVSTTVSGTPTALEGARVTLTCAPGTVTPPDFCPTGGVPARSTGGTPLTVLTAANGSWALPSVPAGSFTVTFTKQGYVTDTASIVVDDVAQTVPMTLTGVNRNVVVLLDPSQPGDSGLSDTDLTLVPLPGTPGTSTTLPTMARTADGSYTATFNAVRWGCYRLDIALPTGHYGTPAGPTGSPANTAELGCPAGATVIVPDGASTPIEIGYTLDEGGLKYVLDTSDHWSGHTVPAVKVVVDRPGSAPDLTIDSAPAEATIWVPAGGYIVTPVVPAADAAYWAVTASGPLTVTGNGLVNAAIALAEKTFPVTVTVNGLPPGEDALIQVSRGVLQQGALPDPASGETVGGTVTFLLPRGKWLIEGSWTTGPDAVVVDVVPCGQDVVLGTTPTSTPKACP